MSYSVGHGEINIYSCFAAVFYTLESFFLFCDTTEVIWFSHLLNEVTPIYFRAMSYQGTNLIVLSQSNKSNMTKLLFNRIVSNSKIYCIFIWATIAISVILLNSLSLNYDFVLEEILGGIAKNSQGVLG